MTPTAPPAEEVAGLATGTPAVGVPGRAAVMWVEGPDAEGFLHGLLSQDVRALAPGGHALGLLLDERGHIVTDVRVHRDAEDAFTLVVDPALGATLAATLERYHFSEDLDLLGPEDAATVVVAEALAARVAGTPVPGVVPGTVEVVVDDPAGALAEAGLETADPEALEALRIERGGVRVGVDTSERTLVQEAALEGRAVSFTKGCYLGQETVARAQHRGRVNRVLRVLTSPAPLSPGAEVVADGRVVGTVTSAAVSPGRGPVALAILRREVAPGDSVSAGGVGDVTVHEVPPR